MKTLKRILAVLICSIGIVLDVVTLPLKLIFGPIAIVFFTIDCERDGLVFIKYVLFAFITICRNIINMPNILKEVYKELYSSIVD